MRKVNTVIIPIIRPDFIGRCLETLYKYTDPNFYVFVVDQTTTDEAYIKNRHLAHLWIRCYRNVGFSKAHNMGIKLAQTPYITLSNDDVEFMNKGWWQGIIDTFNQDHHIIAVNPMSPKEGSWGYGYRSDNKDTWEPPKEFVYASDTKESIYPVKPDGTGLFYKESFTDEDYEFLLNNHPRYRKESVVDAVAMWCTVFKKTGFDKIGLLDEKFYPGGGEDYDMNARAYSCAWPEEREECDNEYHYRMVSTTRSWVWHHWGKSKEISEATPDSPLFSSERWNDNDELWPGGFDVWGHLNTGDKKIPYRRVKKVHIVDL